MIQIGQLHGGQPVPRKQQPMGDRQQKSMKSMRIQENKSVFSFKLLPLCISNIIYGYLFTLISASSYTALVTYYKIGLEQREALSLMNGMLPLGGLIGTLLVGYLLNVVSKKQGFMIAAIGMVIASAITLIPDIGFLLIGRVTLGTSHLTQVLYIAQDRLGIFCSVSLSIASGYLRNLSLIQYRPLTSSLFAISRIIGVLICYSLGMIFQFATDTIQHTFVWMAMAIIAIIQAFLIWGIVPNDPIQLIKNNKKEIGCQIMYNLYGSNAVKQLINRYEYEFNPGNTNIQMYYRSVMYTQSIRESAWMEMEHEMQHEMQKHMDNNQSKRNNILRSHTLRQEMLRKNSHKVNRFTSLNMQSIRQQSINPREIPRESNPRLKYILMGLNVSVMRHFCGLSYLFVYANAVLKQLNSPLLYQASTIINAVLLAGSIPGVFISMKFGRRQLVVVGGCCLCIINAALAIVDSKRYAVAQLCLMIVFMVPCGVIFICSAQSYPPEILLPAMGKYPSIAGWIAQSIVTLIPPYISANGVDAIFGFFSVWTAISVFICWKWMEESKGMSLQQIQANDPII